jgi:hypothetical protein
MITVVHDIDAGYVTINYEPNEPIDETMANEIDMFNEEYYETDYAYNWRVEADKELIYAVIDYADWGVPYQDDKAGLQMFANVIKGKSGYTMDLDNQDIDVINRDEDLKRYKKNNNGN